MDFFQSFSSIVVPRWVKVTVALTLFSLLAVNLLVGFFGITGNEKQEDWLEAAIYLFGVLLPIWLVAFVILYADGGPSALKTKTYHYMARIIPQTLKSIVEDPARYYVAEKMQGRPLQSAVTVYSNQYRDSCIARYIIDFPDRREVSIEMDRKGRQKTRQLEPDTERQRRRIHFALELNVKKANIVVYIPAALAEAACGVIPSALQFDPETSPRPFGYDQFEQLFPHTLTGSKSEGYLVNPSISFERIGNSYFYGVVLIRTLDPKFLTQPQEKLYFAQDLMFMLKAFYNERRDFFEPEARNT